MLKVNDWYFRNDKLHHDSLGILYKIIAINGLYVDVDTWDIKANRTYEWVARHDKCDAVMFEKYYSKTTPLPKVVELLYGVKNKADSRQETDTQIEYTDREPGTDTA